ncbi:uncharacterized protein LOC121526200 isoform X2 [Cheilinus undulatus]|uniref:uncharacterized protein LOC121526200 isoform X2 n=1 Tax=Cheilinus undulatus TaxID=241271 RepID=UPI001BD1ED34|nr:uncharacterized protein LOC121526200 isoform X2 [Cheilinus undulatus]
MSVLQLPAELWLQVFSFLSWKDKLSVRCTCSHFKHLVDKSRPLWRGFTVMLRDFSRYNRQFWCSLAQRHVGRVYLRSGKRKHLKQLSSWLPGVDALRLDDWREDGVGDLKLFPQLKRLAVTSCYAPLKSMAFLFPVRDRLTQLSLCGLQLTCSVPHLLDAIAQLTRLTTLRLHHDGSLLVTPLSGLLAHLSELTYLSITAITYKTLPNDFFSPAHPTGGAALKLTDLQLLNYDAAVTPEVLQSLSNVRNLWVYHLYSVPGPVCHLQTWLRSLTQLHSLSVHGGHPLAAYADLLPSSLVSLKLCVDLQPDDLHVISARAPRLEHLYLEPWNSSSNLVRLIPQLFPNLRTLRINHLHISDEDFLSLQQLQRLNTLEILDLFHRPDPRDPSWVVYGPSPRLQRLTSDLQQQTDHRVRVVTSVRRDRLTCECI